MSVVQQPTQARVYNAIYSSVQVYECMVRGIAVMRRRVDSYVNATQILKVAGIDKGRRTKILEKEILPGKHEIVQGGYGKYQGTWIPLDRGRDVAMQFGVAPLLAPLFDYMPTPASVGTMPASRLPPPMPVQIPHQAQPHLPMHLQSHHYMGQPVSHPPPYIPHFPPHPPPGMLLQHPNQQMYQLPPPPPFPPTPLVPSSQPPPPPHPPAPNSNSALTLLQQGRAQGLFTPHSSTNYQYQPHPAQARTSRPQSSTPSAPPVSSGPSPRPPPQPQASTSVTKRTRVEEPPEPTKDNGGDVVMEDNFADSNQPQTRGSSGPSRPPSQQSPKRPRTLPDVDMTDGAASTTSNGVPPPPPPLPLPPRVNPDDLKSRFFTKPSQPVAGDRVAPLKNAHANSVLTMLVRDSESSAIVDLLLRPPPDPNGPSPDIDLIIDDQGHTALHWAASLARYSLVSLLIHKGADVHRGNYAGETPLVRSVLDVSAFESQSFPSLLTLLAPSIRTVDSSSRSVLHHIALIAGVKTRGPSARYYMECVLEYIARNEGGDRGMKSVVDLQDVHGDTALNVAARVGNRSLVRNLVDVGANKILANKLGLKPGDFGVEGEVLKAPTASDILSTLRTGPSAPVQKSQDVISEMTTMIQSLSNDFSAELKVKQDALDVTQAHLRAATRQLAEQRRQIQQWQNSCTELDEVNQRVRNVERALKEEDDFDWTGRTELSGEPTSPNNSSAGPAFYHRGPNSTLSAIGSGFDVSFTFDVDPSMPSTDTILNTIKLKRLNMWHSRIEELMRGRLEKLKGDTAEKEFMCKRIVSLCTGVQLDQVETMLENLIIAMESDGAVPELGRVAGFMQKVKDGSF